MYKLPTLPRLSPRSEQSNFSSQSYSFHQIHEKFSSWRGVAENIWEMGPQFMCRIAHYVRREREFIFPIQQHARNSAHIQQRSVRRTTPATLNTLLDVASTRASA